MSRNLKKVLGIIGFVLLFAFVVYMKTRRKLERTGVIKKENTGQTQYIVDVQKQQDSLAYEQARAQQQKERDSVRQLQRDQLEEQKKKTEAILREMEQE